MGGAVLTFLFSKVPPYEAFVNEVAASRFTASPPPSAIRRSFPSSSHEENGLVWSCKLGGEELGDPFVLLEPLFSPTEESWRLNAFRRHL